MTEPSDDIEETLEFEGEEAFEDAMDEFFSEARQIYEEFGDKTSVSMLQRKLKIGYARAASLLDTLKTGGTQVSLEAQPHGGALKREKKIDPTGLAFYEETFIGYQTLEFIRDLVPAFKEYYYERMIKDTSSKLTHIVRDFNKQLQELPEPRRFHPYTGTLRNWKKKWDKDIMAKKGMQLEVITTKKHVQQVMKTQLDGSKDGAVVYEAPGYESLELGVQTLGGELMNDAMQMLQDDRDLEDTFESDELIKRKNYILTVFTQVTKMVQGKAALMLKTSEEKRNNAHFLMDLMKSSTSGKMSLDEIAMLRSTYTPKKESNVESFT